MSGRVCSLGCACDWAGSVGDAVREGFRGYFQPSKQEFDTLWADGEIVVDTNVLLNLFRYPAALRDDLLKILRDREDRLWLPHQVALEFHSRRWNVVGEQEGKFDAIDRALREARAPVNNAIKELHRLPAAESAELRGQFETALESFEEALARHKESWGSHDEIFTAVTALYDGRVGSPYNSDELGAAQQEGAERFEMQIPPGFKDQGKPDDRQYGDWILWKQLLEHSAAVQSPVIFVTDDGKEDWWVKTSGKQRMPRPELIEEFFQASGQRIHIYSVKRFLSFVEERGVEVSKAATEEARRAQEIAEDESMRRLKNVRAMRRAQEQAAAAHPSRYVPDSVARMDRALDAVPQERLDAIRRAFHNTDVYSGLLDEDELSRVSRSIGERLGLREDAADAVRAAGLAAGIEPGIFDAYKRVASDFFDGALPRAQADMVDSAAGVGPQGALDAARRANRSYREALVQEGIVDGRAARSLTLIELQALEAAYRARGGALNGGDDDAE